MSAGWVDVSKIEELDRLVKNIKIYGGDIKYSAEGISIVIPQRPATKGGGTQLKWAKITNVVNANDYVAEVYEDRQKPDKKETNKKIWVYDLVDKLAVGDWIPVQATTKQNYHYENAQQLGLL